jgi:hypothetical protein
MLIDGALLVAVERIDQHAEDRGESRSGVMRRFLEKGLARESVPVKHPKAQGLAAGMLS